MIAARLPHEWKETTVNPAERLNKLEDYTVSLQERSKWVAVSGTITTALLVKMMQRKYAALSVPAWTVSHERVNEWNACLFASDRQIP